MITFAIGFGLIISWLWLFYLQGPLLSPCADLWFQNPNTLFSCFIGAHSLTCLFLAKGIKVRSLLHKQRLLLLCAVILSLCPLLTAVLPYAGVTNQYLPFLFAVAGGVALAPFLTAWAQIFVLSDLRKLSLSFSAAITIAGIITLLGGSFYYGWILPLVVLAPFISLLLLREQIKLTANNQRDDVKKIDVVNPFPPQLIILIGLFYVAGGTMFDIIGLGQSFVVAFYFSIVSYTLFCLLMGGLFYRYYPKLNLNFFYRPALPLFVIGFFLLVLQPKSCSLLAFMVLQGGAALFDMYTWLLYPYFARFSSRPAAVCAFGLFLTTFSMFCGNQLINLLTILSATNIDERNLAFIGGTFSVLSALIFRDKKETFAGWEAALEIADAPPAMGQWTPLLPEPGKGTTDLPLLSLLSERENEILALLLKGRNGRFISETLNISANTVKTHIRHIYDKLSVNNRQELLSLFDNNV